MTKMDKEMIKQMEQFQKDFPDATPKEKRDFLEFLSLCALFEISEDDPFGILKDDGKLEIINNKYEQAKFIARLNNNSHWERDSDEWNGENEAYQEWCNKVQTSPKTANKPVKEQYVYAPDIDDKKYKWYRVTETGLVEAPDYIPPDDTK